MQQSSTSESVPLPQSTDITNNVKSNDGLQQHDTHLWFTQMLPEGCCVGVCTTKPSSSDIPILSDMIIEDLPSLNSTTFLHSDEYSWGQSNIASDSSRTSYYLGRTAIRLSINTLIRNRTMDQETGQELNYNSNNAFYSQLNDQIESTAIRKDYYGRPILPEIILGSISHKGNYAVGLSRFCSSDEELNAVDMNALQWREECLISDDDDDETSEDTEIDDASCSSSTTTRSVRGIGIDLEFIDIKRGKRIKKRVLTENEQKELGQLEVRDTHRHVHTLSDLYHAATSFAISMLVLMFIFYCHTISSQSAYQERKKYC